MESVTNLLILNIGFILLQCVSYTHTNCVTREYKRFPQGVSLTAKNSVFQMKKLSDVIECVQWCAGEVFCSMWTYGNGECEIFHSEKDKVEVAKSSNKTMDTYFERVKDEKWTKVFFVKNGSGFKVRLPFFGEGDYHSWGPESCTLNLCPDFFRSSLMDDWDKLPINKVKLSLIKNNREVRYLIFDGQETNSTSWFKMSRVLESSWRDVHKGAMTPYFGMDWYKSRTFYAAKHHSGCKYDTGWIAVLERNGGCTWEYHQTYPQIVYSGRDTATKWQDGYAVADALLVYISF